MTLETRPFTRFKSDQCCEWSTNTILLSFHSLIGLLVEPKQVSVQSSIDSPQLMTSVPSIPLRVISMALTLSSHQSRQSQTSRLYITNRLEVMQDHLICRRCALFHAWPERISQRRTEIRRTLRSTQMFRDRGSTPRTLLWQQCANSQKSLWARFSHMTTPSLFLLAMESGLRSPNLMSQVSSAELEPMLLSRRTILSPESEKP